MSGELFSEKVKDIHQDLIERCKNNDRIAQMKIYDLYNKAVYNSALRILKNPMEAEDVMQDSFLSAFNKIHTFRFESSFGTWIKKIAINRSLNALQKHSPDILDMPEGNIPDQIEENDENYEKFSIDEIKEEINALPEGFSLVLNLHLLEGMDHDEIGQILNIKPVTSRSQYMRGKQKLVMNLKEKYHARQA
jgi:RNA polymerase sigma-70 factor (ECF subfamily)